MTRKQHDDDHVDESVIKQQYRELNQKAAQLLSADSNSPEGKAADNAARALLDQYPGVLKNGPSIRP